MAKAFQLYLQFFAVNLFCFIRKNLLRDMTDLTTMQTAFFLNVQSIKAHHDQLSVLNESFDNKPALIGLTEKWLSDNDPIGIYNLEGYDNTVCANRVNAIGGRVAAFIETGLNYNILNYQSVWGTSLSKCVLSITLH